MKKGSLRFPKEKDTPVIMVGPGTGLAPFRSSIQERIAEGKYGEFFISVVLEWLSCVVMTFFVFHCPLANVLFFGCRFEFKDFYFKSEWEHLMKAGHLCLFTAFSRDQVRNGHNVHVNNHKKGGITER